MNKEHRSYPVIHIGTSFLLVIFIVLCLVVFAVLSLSSSMRDQTYVKKEAERTIAYYEANGKAQEKLGETVEGAGGTLPVEDDAGGTLPVVQFSVPINDTQTLEVAIQLDKGKKESNRIYQIRKWEVTNSGDWNADTTLPIMKSK